MLRARALLHAAQAGCSETFDIGPFKWRGKGVEARKIPAMNIHFPQFEHRACLTRLHSLQ
jgi:hypothetical protein